MRAWLPQARPADHERYAGEVWALGQFTMGDVIDRCLGMDGRTFQVKDQFRIGRILRKAGYEKFPTTFKDRTQGKMWFKEAD